METSSFNFLRGRRGITEKALISWRSNRGSWERLACKVCKSWRL